MPAAKPGAGRVQSQFLPSACVAWRTRMLTARNTGDLNPAEQRARKDQKQADLAEQTLQMRAGELVRVAVIEQLLAPRIGAAKTQFEAMPRAVAPECVRAAERGGARAVEAVLHDYVRDLLKELAAMGQPL